jgi:hypothetical protein
MRRAGVAGVIEGEGVGGGRGRGDRWRQGEDG